MATAILSLSKDEPPGSWFDRPNVNGLDNTCTLSLTTCNPAGDTFGQILNSRAPREIQLGLKFYW